MFARYQWVFQLHKIVKKPAPRLLAAVYSLKKKMDLTRYSEAGLSLVALTLLKSLSLSSPSLYSLAALYKRPRLRD